MTGWPAAAEESIIARDVLLAEHVGARLHICHVSTAGSGDVVRWAKARGIRVTRYANGGFATSMPVSEPAKSHGRLFTPPATPMSSRIGRMT